MSKGTVIYIGGFELPDKNAAAHRVLNNGKIFRDIGYKVVFIGVDKSLNYDSSILDTRKEIQGFDNWFVPYPHSNKHWVDYLCSIKDFVRVANKYSDVRAVICYNYQAIAFYKIEKFCHKRNIKIIADCTEWYSTEGAKVLFKIIKGCDSFLRMRVIQKRVDGLIVISQYLENYYNNCKEIIRIPPLVDLAEDKWGLPIPENSDDKINFVYAGSPGINKDKINLLIEILHKLKEKSDFTFYVVGITKEEYLENHSSQNKLIENLNGRVIFLGRLPHLESLKYIRMSDFSIFLREDTRVTKAGFPTKFVESISCGIPVITNNTSDLQCYLIENVNGYFVNIQNSQLMSKKLGEILNLGSGQMAKMKKLCLESQMFDYKKYAPIIREFMENVCLKG